MYRIILAVFIFTISSMASAQLEVGKVYRVKVKTTVTDSNDTALTVLANSKFEVVEKADNGDYHIIFTKVYESSADEYKSQKWAQVNGEVYILSKMYNNLTPVENVTTESFSGLNAGALIVPYKYRLGEDTLAGDATIGMYFGATFDSPTCKSDVWCFQIAPIASAGLSQVGVNDGAGNSDNKTAVTWAAGLLLKNWDTVNIGLVYGEDRIGDKDWKHEGDGWVSIMVGWEL